MWRSPREEGAPSCLPTHYFAPSFPLSRLHHVIFPTRTYSRSSICQQGFGAIWLEAYQRWRSTRFTLLGEHSLQSVHVGFYTVAQGYRGRRGPLREL